MSHFIGRLAVVDPAQVDAVKLGMLSDFPVSAPIGMSILVEALRTRSTYGRMPAHA
jgi:hypothetical protein